METRAWIAIILMLLAGCSRPTVNVSSEATKPSFALTPQTTPSPKIAPKTSTPRTLKLKLTLDSPADLKVVQGQTVVKEQILSDRASARDRLTAQRQVLLLRSEQLKQPQASILASTSRIPEPSYAEEHARIAGAKLEVEQAQTAHNQFLASSPWTDYARSQLNMRSEQQKLAELQANLQHKKANLNLAIAQLQSAKEEYQQQVNVKQLMQDNSFEQAQLLAQLNAIDKEIAQLGVVRSPYNGTIKKIKWVGQSDRELTAELTIAVQDNISTVVAAKKPFPRTATKVQKSTKATTHPGSGFQPTWQVLSVHDGDTIRVRQGQKVERIRFACIDAPELKQPLGKAARISLQQTIKQNGDRVSLHIVDTDRYGRRVAEVFAGGKLLQEQQIRSGMAYIYERYLNNCPSTAALRRADAIARNHRAGVWSGNYETPWDYRKRIRTQ